MKMVTAFNSNMKVLGRLASQIATVVQGKDKPTNTPNHNDGDMCIVLNAKDVCVTGRKLTDKVCYWHTGQVLHLYVGHLKERTLKDEMAKDPTEVICKAVLRMLPRNKPRNVKIPELIPPVESNLLEVTNRTGIKKLRIFPGSEHPSGDQPLEPYVMPSRSVREMRP
ncbi:50S ribosomal protein L13 [Spatholobus suberectus]|nr:50S ribosomal protein L13 [Spatholobus suberectus]